MIDGRRVILTTFAGRRDRMNLFLIYARAAIAAGIVDELHVWDFTRKPEDKLWLETEFPNVRRLPDKLSYRKVDQFVVDADGNGAIEIGFRNPQDFHLRVTPTTPAAFGYEIVLGGWTNTKSVIRQLSLQTGADPLSTEIAAARTLGLASDQVFKTVKLDIFNRVLSVSVDDRQILQAPVELPAGQIDLLACSGYGAGVDIKLSGKSNDPESLFIAKNQDTPPFSEFYNYYASRFHEHKDDVFLKSDDDIIYCDLTRLADFIKFRVKQSNYFIVSANVVNNGVCAYFQQQSGLIPQSLMQLELPPGGFCGMLWQSAELASSLHDFFLQHPGRFTSHYQTDSWVEWDQRLSINFIAWLGRDLAELACYHADDEQAVSCDIPARLGRTNAIYSPLIVSHLSFYPQDQGINVPALMARYAGLCPAG